MTLFDRFQLAIVLGWACLGIGRGVMMRRRGVNVLAPDTSRTRMEVLSDGVTALCLLLAFWELIAYSVSLSFHFGFGCLGVIIVDLLVAKVIGGVSLALALVVYGKALIDLGSSWRLGADPKSAGELVTKGIYALVRHPIYLSFDLFCVGGFLATGRLVFLVLLLVLLPLLHLRMLREERHLEGIYGERYRRFRSQVQRYGVC